MTDLVEKLRGFRDKLRSKEQHYQADMLCEAIRVIEDYQRMMGTREYALARPASMPNMDGRQRYTIISSARFGSAEQADTARRDTPIADALIVSRIAPASEWEECNE